jgi:hypothetical protein
MPETFESLLVKLSRADVEYLVAGGVAVCLNGSCAPQKIWTFWLASPANVQRLLDVLARFGGGSARELTADDFHLEEGAVRLNENFTVGLFTLMRSRTFADFRTTALALQVSGTTIWYLAPESLIELKAPSRREKDRLDVAALREILAGTTSRERVDLIHLTPPPEPSD